MNRRDREARRQVLKDGLLAAYWFVDKIRKELDELDALDKAENPVQKRGFLPKEPSQPG